jgi:hypothetical protein
MRRVLFLSGCCVALLAPAAARGDDFKIEGPGRMVLLVTAGKGVGLFTKGHPDAGQTDWEIGDNIKVSSGRRQGYYLAYDPTGKKPGVFLSKEPGEGTTWKRPRAKGEGPPARHVQADEGAVKGRYLMPGKAKEVRDKDGKVHTSYDLILVEKPKKPAVFDFIVIGK